jgi:hypothetical protein
MFLHEFGEDLVLALELLFQGGDPAILVVVGTSGPGFKCGGGVLEEFLLPAIEHGGVDVVLIAEVRDGGMFQEMKPQDGGLLLDGESFPSLLGHGRISARGCSLFEQTICPISTEAKQLLVTGPIFILLCCLFWILIGLTGVEFVIRVCFSAVIEIPKAIVRGFLLIGRLCHDSYRVVCGGRSTLDSTEQHALWDRWLDG